MKISRHWARESGSATNPDGDNHYLVAWSGSDKSEADAKTRAKLKLADWIARFSAGRKLIDEYPYGVDDSIREELIEEINDASNSRIGAITRNRYGALVLNAANVMFIDVDLPVSIFHKPGFFARLFSKKPEFDIDDAKAQCRQQFRDFQSKQTHLSLRVYETAAGFRLVVLNKMMDPLSDESENILNELKSDNLYRILCRNQQCYRARLTSKPWRIAHKSPAVKFPRNSKDEQDSFADWLRIYTNLNSQYGVCNQIEVLGDATALPEIEQILKIHDKYVINATATSLA